MKALISVKVPRIPGLMSSKELSSCPQERFFVKLITETITLEVPFANLVVSPTAVLLLKFTSTFTKLLITLSSSLPENIVNVIHFIIKNKIGPSVNMFTSDVLL